MVLIGADLLHRLPKIHPLRLTVLTESSRSNQIALWQTGIFESGTNTLDVIVNCFVGLSDIGDRVSGCGQNILSARDFVRVHNLNSGVKYATSQVQVGTIITTGSAFALLTNINAGGNVAIGLDGGTNSVANRTGDLQVIACITENIVFGNQNGNAQPSASTILYAKLNAVDLQLDVDGVTLLKGAGSRNAIVLISTGIKCYLYDIGRCTNASNAQVTNRALLEESLDAKIGVKFSTAGRQSSD